MGMQHIAYVGPAVATAVTTLPSRSHAARRQTQTAWRRNRRSRFAFRVPKSGPSTELAALPSCIWIRNGFQRHHSAAPRCLRPLNVNGGGSQPKLKNLSGVNCAGAVRSVEQRGRCIGPIVSVLPRNFPQWRRRCPAQSAADTRAPLFFNDWRPGHPTVSAARNSCRPGCPSRYRLEIEIRAFVSFLHPSLQPRRQRATRVLLQAGQNAHAGTAVPAQKTE